MGQVQIRETVWNTTTVMLESFAVIFCTNLDSLSPPRVALTQQEWLFAATALASSQLPSKMANTYGNKIRDFGAWLLNVSSAATIILINKVLMGSEGFHFNYAVTLSGGHFLASSAAMHIARMAGLTDYGNPIPTAGSVTSIMCVVSLTLSLMVNTVGFYQVAKLLNIPFVCLVEYMWFGRSFSLPVLLSIASVVGGVGAVTVSDVTVRFGGLFIAALSVLGSGTQQVLCSWLQKRHTVTSTQLLLNSAFSMGMGLLMVGPFLDKVITGSWVTSYKFTQAAVVALLGSCAIAILVNLSQFMVLGRLTPVAYQVMGHAKTFLVLLIGVVHFHERISGKEADRMGIAVLGMISYGYFSSRPSEPSKDVSSAENGETVQFIDRHRRSGSVHDNGIPVIDIVEGRKRPTEHLAS